MVSTSSAERVLDLVGLALFNADPPEIIIRKNNGIPSAAAAAILKESCEVLGVRDSQLAKLIDLDPPHHIFLWIDGDRSPEPLYLARLIKLHILSASGLPMSSIRRIDWDSARVIFRD